LTGAVFYVGFQLAAPIFIVMFLVDFTLGVAAKTVPQMQILVVGFPLKIAVGLIIIGLAMGPIARFIISMMEQYRDNLMWLFKFWGSGP
jgi:flagellar biosynthetic protein FliR